MNGVHRVRIGFFLTLLIGAIYASAGLFSPTDKEFFSGLIVAMIGIIGMGAVDWVEK